MPLNTRMTIAGFAALTLIGAAPFTQAAAQNAPRSLHARPRIEITPRPLLHRRCTDWLELQQRPSGTVLYPQYRCWWVRG